MHKDDLRTIYGLAILNKKTIFIFIISLLTLIVMFISASGIPFKKVDYILNYNIFWKDYLYECIHSITLINLFTITLINAMYHLTFKNRLELLFIMEFNKSEIIKVKIKAILNILIKYITAIYIILLLIPSIVYDKYVIGWYEIKLYLGIIIMSIYMLFVSELIIVITNHALSIILFIGLYLMSNIMANTNPLISELLFLKVNVESKEVFNISIIGGIIYCIITYILLVTIYSKKDLKLN